MRAPFFTRVDEDRYWPSEVRWVRDKLKIRSGTPRYVVVVDNAVVSNTFGTGSWTHTVYPLIQRLVAQKTGGQ